ncbi:exported hypothetical protein [Cupriavidus taiwanensis]|nr:exported hypothetical protein [Cupriavidus taiwanensis]
MHTTRVFMVTTSVGISSGATMVARASRLSSMSSSWAEPARLAMRSRRVTSSSVRYRVAVWVLVAVMAGPPAVVGGRGRPAWRAAAVRSCGLACRAAARINGSAKALRRSPATTETLARARFGPGPAMGDESGWEPGGIRRCADPAGGDRALGALGQTGRQGNRGRVRAAGPQRADRRIGHRRQAIGHGLCGKG